METKPRKDFPNIAVKRDVTARSGGKPVYRFAKRMKISCPSCGKKTFVPYVDADNQILDKSVGKCDRAYKCAYHQTPREFFDRNPHLRRRRRPSTPVSAASVGSEPSLSADTPFSTIDPREVDISMTVPVRNRLRDYIHRLLDAEIGADIVDSVLSQYRLGNSNRFIDGAAVYWQIDIEGRVRTGKIMGYDDDGHRRKYPVAEVTWVHSPIKDYRLRQCLFGEHLLADNPDAVVVVVESEKTALILGAALWWGLGMSLPHTHVVVATGGCSNLSAGAVRRLIDGDTGSPLNVLKGRRVVLSPDTDAALDWIEAAAQLSSVCPWVRVSPLTIPGQFPDSVAVSSISAPRRGEDIADLIARAVRRVDGLVTVISHLY